MNETDTGWLIADKAARWLEKLWRVIIWLILVVALAYGCFGLWDTWNIYRKAGLDDTILSYQPQLSEDATNPSLSQLQALYPDVCAWLTVDDTNINYPVVQGQTNLEYINKGVDGSFSLTGSIFLDNRNDRDFSDPYSVIYGHHMAGKVMFGEITDFLEEDYFEEHTTGWLFLADKTYEIKWFACLSTNAYDKYMYGLLASSRENVQQERLDYIQENATQYRDLGVTADQQLIALSTCSSGETDGRTILVGWLQEIEEGVSEPTE
jgi:sortase B